MKKILATLLASTLLLTGCFGQNTDKTTEEENIYGPVTDENLQNNMFYVKSGDSFYPLYMGKTTIGNDSLIAKEVDSSRIISFTEDEANIPTLYKDDSLIYYTTNQVPTFTWERFKDQGYSVGMYNLQPTESGNVQFEVGTSMTNANSDAYAGLSQIELEESVIIVDQVAGKSISSDDLSDCGSITGLKADEQANIDIYVGTQHYTIESTVDTRILSSMELYETTEYNLLPEGYASIVVPDYFLSGYYLINGVGVVRYVNNNRSEGISNIDFSTPYWYEDENGNKYTYQEWLALTGEVTEEENDPDYTFTYNIDSTITSLKFSLSYELIDGEDPSDILYVEPSGIITSPLGETIEMENGTDGDLYTLTADIEGVTSGDWKIDIYNLGERKFDVAITEETGNADSFVHSGSSSGRFSIHSDGINETAHAAIRWENTQHAATVSITSPSGTKYTDNENADLLIVNSYGEKVFELPTAEAGTWELEITGEDLGRCWFTITPASESDVQREVIEETVVNESTEETVPEETPSETVAETQQ